MTVADGVEVTGSAVSGVIPVEGQTVVVTGAAQGLGAAIARHFHERGAQLILMDINAEGLEETATSCPGAVTVVLKFPSMEALRGWYDSPEYQEIISLRTDNTEGGMVFANEFVMPG